MFTHHKEAFKEFPRLMFLFGIFGILLCLSIIPATQAIIERATHNTLFIQILIVAATGLTISIFTVLFFTFFHSEFATRWEGQCYYFNLHHWRAAQSLIIAGGTVGTLTSLGLLFWPA